MTNKELSMRLKKAGFEATTQWCWSHHVSSIIKGKVTRAWALVEYLDTMPNDTNIPAYDAEVLYEWLRGWHRDDPFRSFEIQNDGIIAFDWGPRDNAKWIEYETSLADMLAEAILWVLEDDDAQTKD